MAVPVKLATVRVQGTENADGESAFLCGVQQIVGRQSKQMTQEPAVDGKQRPQGIGERERTVLASRVGQASHHRRYPDIGGLFATGRASSRYSSGAHSGDAYSSRSHSKTPGCPSAACRMPASL